jgi:hypothetical protein
MDDLLGRRKKRLPSGGTAKMAETKGFQAGIPANPYKTGTSAFGLEAGRRKEKLRRGGRTDLRVKTAAKTVTTARDLKNKYLAGD